MNRSGQIVARPRLVSIDDDEVERTAVRRALAPKLGDFSLEEHDSVAAGVTRLLTDPVDCVLLGHSPPGCDALEILARLRAAKVDSPVIVLTGVGDEDFVVEALRRGAYDCLPRSRLDGETLWDKIHTTRRLFEIRARTRATEAELHARVQRLREAIASREGVLSVVSHDLRGPLNNIELAMSLLEQPGLDPAHLQLTITNARRAVRTAKRLIGDLVDLIEISGEQLELVRRPVEIAALVEAALANVDLDRHRERISLDLGRGTILADSDRVVRALENLFRHVLEYRSRAGIARVEAHMDGDGALFTISDEGPVLDPEERSQLFDRFWQAEDRRGASSAALELAIAKRLVEAHGGEIGVESCKDGGTQLYFRLPPRGSSGGRAGPSTVAWSGSPTPTTRRWLEQAPANAARQRARAASDELRDSAEQLREALRVRDGVIGVASHDLRGPLEDIELAIDLLEGEEPEDQRQSAVARARRAVRRANRLIGDLLEVAALGGGGLELDMHPVRPDGVVASALADIRPVLEDKQVVVHLDIADGLPPMRGDRHRVVQILDNLLRHAIERGARGGQVWLEVCERGGALEFSIRDRGPGLDWRANEPEVSTGSGLGLAIAEGLVERHGGQFGVESPPSGGARFHFTIPIELEPEQ